MTPRRFTYNGASMMPLFRPGDDLRVEVISQNSLRAGDVNVYPSPEDGMPVVHRVVSVAGKTILTRGDNAMLPDDYTLSAEDVTGRVISLRRNRKTIPIRRGFAGILQYRKARLRNRIGVHLWRLAAMLLRIRWIAERAGRRMRVVRYVKPAGVVHHLMWGDRVIARTPPDRAEWIAAAPFRRVPLPPIPSDTEV